MFIVALTSHRYLGHLLVPYLVDAYPTCYVVRALVRPADLLCTDRVFTEQEADVVKIAWKYSDFRLAKRFSRDISSKDFFASVDPDLIGKQIIPYVHKQMGQLLRYVREGKIPLYEKEGKARLNIGFGCTGGKHRSVVMANQFSSHFQALKYLVHTSHRDINKS